MTDITLQMNSYTAYIVDVDGTMYYKTKMQIRMVLCLLWYYIPRIYRFRELFVLYAYRKLREKEEFVDDTRFEQNILKSLSRTFRYSEEQIQRIVQEWILIRPLKILHLVRDKRLLSFLQRQRDMLKKVYVYSDYPAISKCASLGVSADGIYWPDGVHISVLKPSPNGLNYILEQNSLKPSEVLFIGDRAEKDGKCACSANVDCLILKKTALFRWIQYRKLLDGGKVCL